MGTINTSAIEEISDTIIAFVPVILILSVVGWVINAYSRGFSSSPRRKKKKAKTFKEIASFELPETEGWTDLRMFYHSALETIENQTEPDFYYCDFCGDKISKSDKNHSQNCLIEKYKEEIILNVN